MSVDTRKITRRKLRFDTLDALSRELDNLEQARQAGTLRHDGNWTPGQVFNHLATWIERYETRDLPKVPWYMRLVGPFMRGRLIRNGFPAGLPGPTGKVQTEPACSFEEGLARLRTKMDVLRTQPLGQHNAFLGRLSDEDVVQLHLRHAELHLGFLKG